MPSMRYVRNQQHHQLLMAVQSLLAAESTGSMEFALVRVRHCVEEDTTGCRMCGHPRNDHQYRHPFEAPEDEQSRLEVVEELIYRTLWWLLDRTTSCSAEEGEAKRKLIADIRAALPADRRLLVGETEEKI